MEGSKVADTWAEAAAENTTDAVERGGQLRLTDDNHDGNRSTAERITSHVKGDRRCKPPKGKTL